ncbi:hypothetical protein ACFP9V_01950 [Deinococcus radiopugnans]|uniref:hypothetical protein n=1 Tax=Deinococcus radiopugnans TaxID=57497 RepID=UPI003616876E
MQGGELSAVGHNANIFYVEDGKVFGGGHKGMTLNFPALIAKGEEETISWLKSQALGTDFKSTIWDEIWTEAAIVANLDDKELIFGFWEWVPDWSGGEESPYLGDVLGKMFTEFLHYPDMWKVFLEIIQPLWPEWTIELALPAEFAVRKVIITRIQDLKLPLIRDARFPPKSQLTERQKKLGFQMAFAIALGEDSAAYKRLKF